MSSDDGAEREQLSEALRWETERFRFVALATRDAIYDWDIRTGRVWRNETYQALYSPDSPVGTDDTWWERHVHPEHREGVLGSIRQAFAERRTFWSGEYAFLRADGRYASIMDRGYIIFDESGQPFRMLGAMTDVSELKQAMDVQLEVERKNRLLESDLARIWRLNTVGEIASGLAHELSQPIGSILNYAQSVLRRVNRGRQPDAVVVDSVKEICKETERVGKLVASLRAFIGNRDPKKTSEDLNSIVTEIVLLVTREIKEHQVLLRLELAASPAMVSVDRIQIGQVILNLIRNAIESMASAGDARELIVATTIDGACAGVSVADRGCGIPPHDLARVFDPLVSTKSSGMGMGLAISRSIVEAHSGRLWAASEERRGSTFFLSLPLLR